MKNVFYSVLFAGLALVSAACQKADEKALKTSSKTVFTVTGSIVSFDDSKVSYEFSDVDNPAKGLKTTWEKDDVIFGYDNKGGTFTFQVDAVNDGVATFSGSYTPGEGVTKLYAVYYPVPEGKVGEFLADLAEDEELAVDLSAQDGKLGSSTPAIMCATGTISGDRIHFSFTNQTAIVGLYRMRIFDGGKTAEENTAISGVSLNGVSTKGTIKIEDNVFCLVPGDETGDIAASGLNLSTDINGDIIVPTDGSGTISPYFAVIPSPSSNFTVTASNDEKSYTTTGSISGNIEAGKYYQIGKKIGIPVASIGETKYFTISDAFKAATNGETIKLEDNCIVDNVIEYKDLSGNIAVTLDLNGHILTADGTNRLNLKDDKVKVTIEDGSEKQEGVFQNRGLDNFVIQVTSGELEVKSGTIKVPDECKPTDLGVAPIWVEGSKSAKLTISGGSIKGANTVVGSDSYAIYVSNENADINITDGTFTSQSNNVRVEKAKSVNIFGGKFECKTTNKPAIRLAGSGYTCNVGGGEDSGENLYVTCVSNPVYVASSGVSLNVLGGHYNTSNNHINKADKISPKISITGGEFNTLSRCLSDLADGCVLSRTGTAEYKYKVVSAPAKASLKKSYTYKFNNVTNALLSVSETSTVTLLQDDELSQEVNMEDSSTPPSGKLTLDLNNFTLTVDGANRINVLDASASLFIKDGSDQRGGKYYQKTYSEDTLTYAVSVGYGGTFTLESGSIDAAQSGIHILKGTANIKGGKIQSHKKGDAIYCSQNNSKVNIDSGEIIAEGRAVYVRDGITKIIGGTISSVDSAAIAIGIVSSTSDYSPEVTITTTTESTPIISSENSRAVNIRKGKLTIEGGTFNVSQSQALIFGNQKVDKYEVDIKGGEFNVKGTYAVINAYGSGKTNISGGYFKRDSEGTNGIIYKGGSGTPTVTLTGGHFSDNKGLTGWTIPDEYELKDDGSAPYKYYVTKR